ncbi:hypothetical protein DAPPUDRAFT_243752 [Daphnia pulex]|uniref:CUB domain-containing protein n=1 Tax=Daphnia pulex TaxID=6669 RepID=E9GJK5_DAPPU|nr:hypothetical protein DAPPUDRAFT_243752 [Daphnia pulex]|eukprot:EFX80477.1 hypothetical protein DAPPUDRAFT_243752 [Daphnia pulex]
MKKEINGSHNFNLTCLMLRFKSAVELCQLTNPADRSKDACKIRSIKIYRPFKEISISWNNYVSVLSRLLCMATPLSVTHEQMGSTPRKEDHHIIKMRQSALVFKLLVGLCVFVSFTSAGVLEKIPKRKKSPSKLGAGPVEWPTNSSSAVVPNADGGQLRIETINYNVSIVTDMCEGNIVVPLSSSRNVKRNFTVKSTLFPFKRSTPLICSWNVKVSKNCRRGLVTMTINERSRLAGDDGCLNGFYSVSPFMDNYLFVTLDRICGRINFVPAFQWYVEDQQPEVTINLRHVGLDDGYSEGLAFTLSGECLAEGSNMTQSKANRSYTKWMQQLLGQSANFGVPTLVVPDDDEVYATTASPFWADEADDTELNVVQSNFTKQPTKTAALDFDLETPWHVLKNHSAPLRTLAPSPITTTTTSTKPPKIPSISPNISSSANSVEPHPIIHLNYTILNQTAIISSTTTPKPPPPAKPLISGSHFNLETPWHD